MNKGRGKRGRNEEGERRAGFIPPFSHPQPSRRFFFFFSRSLLYAPPALSEHLAQAIVALEDSSLAARNKDTKTNAV